MRIDRLTTKTREALIAAQQLAADRGHPEVYPEHFLVALLAPADGVAAAVLTKAGSDPRAASAEAAQREAAAFGSFNGVTDKPAPIPAGMRAYLLDPKPEMVKASAGIIFANPAALSPERLEMMRNMIARPGNGHARAPRIGRLQSRATGIRSSHAPELPP